jgi:hypothetical protein
MVEGAILHSGPKSGMVGGIGAGILLSFAWITGMLLPGGWLFVPSRKNQVIEKRGVTAIPVFMRVPGRSAKCGTMG